MIEIVDRPIDIDAVLRSISDPGCGAQSLFIGTSRNNADGKEVVRLEYEAYEPMAVAMMQAIAEEAERRWKVSKISIIHRVGVVPIGEASVVIAVAAPHRSGSFDACRYCIDTIKREVPIWKKEVFADGAKWVGLPATPKPL